MFVLPQRRFLHAYYYESGAVCFLAPIVGSDFARIALALRAFLMRK
jgi:hypothetical protein